MRNSRFEIVQRKPCAEVVNALGICAAYSGFSMTRPSATSSRRAPQHARAREHGFDVDAADRGAAIVATRCSRWPKIGGSTSSACCHADNSRARAFQA